MTIRAAGRSLDDALTAFARLDRVLVAVDFDGTLAPFVDDPAQARAIPAAADALRELAASPGTTLALISGRALDSLEAVAEAPPGTILVGSHGAEFRVDGVDTHPPLDEAAIAEVAAIIGALTAVADGHEGMRVERKPAGAALHSRGADPAVAQAAEAEARVAVAMVAPAALVRDGKDVLEFSVLAWTKGDGIRQLRSLTGAQAVLFAGDDVTDEDALAVLGPSDLGVKCGDGETVAPFRVSGPTAVAALIAQLAHLRRTFHSSPRT